MGLEVLQAKYGIVTDAEKRAVTAEATAREARIQLEHALSQHHNVDDIRFQLPRYRWACADAENPIGVCYYGPDDEQCLICGEPEERL